MNLRTGEEFSLFWILHKIMEIFFPRLMFITVTSLLVLCMYKLASNPFLFFAGQDSGQFKEVVFVLPVDLYAE